MHATWDHWDGMDEYIYIYIYISSDHSINIRTKSEEIININHGKAEICQVEENGETPEGEALYHAGVHLHASWLAQVLLEPQA
jgi:hypothetical protein